MKNKRILTALIVSFFTVFFNSCSNEEDTTTSSTINLEEAKLTGFPLLGITPVSIEIVQPTIENNTETEYGKINIVISDPSFLSNIKADITSNELNLSKFDVIPGGNTALSYESQSHTHAIVNVLDKSEELLHYIVTIEAEAPPTPSTLTITDFKFEASKNSQLSEDVIVEKTFTDPNNPNKQTIYLFVPEGTDFSDLTPTATFDAEKVYYTQDTSTPIVDVDTPFPSTETSFDFAYPKSFIIVLKDDINNRIKWVDVFVDIKNPVQLENTDVSPPDVGQSTTTKTLLGVTKWKNVGNHPVEYQAPNTYENKIPDTSTNFITAQRMFPAFGLKPGENADIHLQIAANLPDMEYKTTAVFYSKFVDEAIIIDDIQEPAKLNITVKIID
ncbi:hypothetical protein [Tenacibaculum agarivorans]|uniref:hypothetical protein n=1 Tax=Tenacibaculum agarivorans TaxID=1908389 RepID=UPI00094BB8D9|nr:hypothetical protein [Tenacibaculum agarivorans]